MKKVFLTKVILALFLLGEINAQVSALLLSENPPGLINGNLGNQNNWIQSGVSTDVQVADASPLIYPGFQSGGKYMTLGTIMNSGTYNGRNPYKDFLNGNQVNANPSAAANTVFYLAFTIRVTQPRRNGANIDWLLSYRNNEGKTLGHFFVKFSSVNTTMINFGINSKPDIDSTKASWTTTEYLLNTTYLILLRYDIVENTSNDKVYLWVNPMIGSEPSVATANATQTAGQEDYSPSSTITAFQLHQMPYCSDVQLDGFKTAYGAEGANTAVNSAAAWAALNLSGMPPLPVKFISFDVARRNSDVLIQWSTAEEVQNSHFEIQRSENGSAWITIGMVNGAGNYSSIRNYEFIDRNATAKLLYYRIRQVDLDGGYSFTPVRMIRNGNDATDLKIHSTGGIVNIHFSKPVEGRVRIMLMSASGQIVSDQSVNDPVGQVQLNNVGVARGIYVVVVRNEQDMNVARKIIF